MTCITAMLTNVCALMAHNFSEIHHKNNRPRLLDNIMFTVSSIKKFIERCDFIGQRSAVIVEFKTKRPQFTTVVRLCKRYRGTSALPTSTQNTVPDWPNGSSEIPRLPWNRSLLPSGWHRWPWSSPARSLTVAYTLNSVGKCCNASCGRHAYMLRFK